MKIKKGFLLRQIANNHIVIPVGERVIDFKGMMTLNETGKYIWNCLSIDTSDERLLNLLLKEYDIDEGTAKRDLNNFLTEARKNGVLME